jgi:phage tail sheath protein FI
MAFRVSPGVSIKEVDLTTIVPAVATTPGGFAGYYNWGPVDEIVTVTSETELANIFGKPDNNNYVDFFTPANFLAYGNNCQVVRVVGSAAANSQLLVTGTTATAISKLLINNEIQFGASAGALGSSNSIVFAGKYPGVLGNSIKVAITSGNGITGGSLAADASLGATFIDMITTGQTQVRYFSVGDTVTFSDGTSVTVSGIQTGTTANTTFTTRTATFGDFIGGVTSGITLTASGNPRVRILLNGLLPKAQGQSASFDLKSVYAGYVSTGATTTTYAADAGGNGDLINVLVLDKDGKLTGTQNALIEKFEGLSRASDARKFDGSSNYYRTVVNEQSNYIWALSQDINADTARFASATNLTALGAGINSATTVGSGVMVFGLTGGASGGNPTDSERWSTGWSKFVDADTVDVSLLPTGSASATLEQLIIQNLCEKRLDCMAFCSPLQSDVENKLPYEALSAIKTYRDSSLNISSSYAVLDSGWKYQLDTYNNIVRIVPLNGDIAGLVARTEFTNEAWFSPAGFNRGQLKNVVKLAYNPSSEAHRDELYTRQVNPVVSFPGEGTILFGDKTMQTKPSAFDRINVRRLFIILEKAIATASKFFLFEQNDAFTRSQFKNLVVPFLKTVQQRRGITDFKVVCDEPNNPGEVIDRNEFVADIFVKPTRSINFIQLNFIATKTGVEFSEVGG